MLDIATIELGIRIVNTDNINLLDVTIFIDVNLCKEIQSFSYNLARNISLSDSQLDTSPTI